MDRGRESDEVSHSWPWSNPLCSDRAVHRAHTLIYTHAQSMDLMIVSEYGQYKQRYAFFPHTQMFPARSNTHIHTISVLRGPSLKDLISDSKEPWTFSMADAEFIRPRQAFKTTMTKS